MKITAAILKSVFNSVRKKTFVSFLGILLMLLSVLVFTQYVGNRTNRRYSHMVEKLLLLNDICAELDGANNSLQKYMEYFLPDDYAEASKCSADLMRDMASLAETERREIGYNRAIVDLEGMIANYCIYAKITLVEKHQYTARCTDAAYLAGLNRSYGNAEQTYSIISRNIKEAYTVLLREVADVQRATERTTRMVYALTMVLLLFSLVSSVFLFNVFSRYIMGPTQRLMKFAQRVSAGEFDIGSIDVRTGDEMQVLSEAFDEMLVTIRKQIREIEASALVRDQLRQAELRNLQASNELKKAELKALQSRINPHFLFNTLNLISQTAYLENAEQTVTLIDATAELLRYNLDKLDKSVALGDEIVNLENYLFIQRKRFGDRILFSLSIDDSLKCCRIPCLIVQPIVENSIIHGVGRYTSGAVVEVAVRRIGDRICLAVADNGLGMDEPRLQNLLSGILAADFDENEAMGLKNVYMRLRLFFDDDVRLSITSTPKVRTEISLEIPMV